LVYCRKGGSGQYIPRPGISLMDPQDAVLQKLQRAFWAHGYDQFTMIGLAKAVGAGGAGDSGGFRRCPLRGARRQLSASPHTVELNDQACKRCRDIMIDAAVAGKDRLAEILVDFQEAGLVR
jgi:hypothetical protein